MDTIQPNAHVVLEYELFDEDGAVLDSSRGEGGEPIVYVHGYGMLVPGLEVALDGLRAGETREVVLGPGEAFGDRDEELVLEVDRSELPRPDDVAVGDEIVAETPDGEEELRVIEVRDDAVVLDANHPLAGKTLRYEVEVKGVRAASDAEIEAAARDFESAGYGAGEDDPSLVQLRPNPGTSSGKR
jgi:FKBP-type peptidyl-prolyl cis-trans isomerase SlyD